MRHTSVIDKPLVQMVILGILILMLYFSVVRDLVLDWVVDENYSHGFLIPLIAAFFIWRKRDALRAVDRTSSGLGLFVFLGGLLLFLVAYIAAEYFTMRLSLLVVMGGLVLYLWGREYAKELLFPLLYLIFMIPLPYVLYYSLSFPLELQASRMTVVIVRLMGIPIIREGNILHLKDITLQVIDACSGLRSLISLTALSAAMAYVTQRTVLTGVILFLASVPVAIIANVLRLSATAVLATLYGEQAAHGFFHGFSGVIVFLFAVISLALIGGFLRWLSAKRR
jgi:exosortase